MIQTHARGRVLAAVLSVAALGIAACGGGSSSTETSVAPISASAVGPTVTYCEPLSAAYAVKPATGSIASDESLAIFAAALEPAAIAAEADGKPEVAALFMLLVQMNAAPDLIQPEDVDEAFAQLAALAPTVEADCGVDLMQ